MSFYAIYNLYEVGVSGFLYVRTSNLYIASLKYTLLVRDRWLNVFLYNI